LDNTIYNIQNGGIEMEKEITVKRLFNNFKALIKSIEAQHIYVCRLCNWAIVLVNKDVNEENYIF
jgi:hypothetical protein